MNIVEVAVPVPLFKIFDYQYPSTLTPKVGQRVIVPFGKRKLVGIILTIKTDTIYEPSKLKEIYSFIDNEPLIPNSMLLLLKWASQYYFSPIGEVIENALPKFLRDGKEAIISKTTLISIIDNPSVDINLTLKNSRKQLELFNKIRDLKQISKEQFAKLGGTSQIKKALIRKNLIHETISEKIENNNHSIIYDNNSNFNLNLEQKNAVEEILKSKDKYTPFVLQGVTGSGKTFVYINLIKEFIKHNKQCLILVPEIGLTPAIAKRLNEYFRTPIALYHSNLTDKERLNSYLKAKNGESLIIVGTRSSGFLPLKNPGIFILDESHDLSFKQQDGFRYNARDLLIKRAQIENCPVVLGSATPDFETLHNIQKNRYTHLRLTKRATNNPLPPISILDIRHNKLESGISSQLKLKIKEHLNNNGQVLIFLNRRGYAPILMCYECGFVAKCINCDCFLNLHKSISKLKCHHCDYSYSLLKSCPKCSSDNLNTVGVGTQKLEDYLKEEFPLSKVSRIDRDSTRKKGSLQKALTEVESLKTNILIGTQMLSKGHDFPNITLVAILDLDNALFSTDYRAIEHLGQLITQVAGRAGRKDMLGEVILQSAHPENELLNLLIKNSYDEFANKALNERKFANLPPFSHQALFRAESLNLNTSKSFLIKVKELLNNIITSYNKKNKSLDIIILGPISTPMEKKLGKFRMQLLLQSPIRANIHNLIKTAFSTINSLDNSKIRWSIDIDPLDMLN